MAAMADGVCVDTTMGFTPAGGLVMGTRAGDIDPGLVAYLCRLEGWDFQQFDRVVNHESGLLGLSGRSADVRELLQAADADPSAALALEVFCHVARKNLCALAGSLGGLDRVVFSGGIGENSPAIRSGICAGLDFLGIRLDPAANAKNQPTISSATSQVPVDVISADEEETMTRITATLLPDLSTLSHHTLTPH
jgi:acetate kinase